RARPPCAAISTPTPHACSRCRFAKVCKRRARLRSRTSSRKRSCRCFAPSRRRTVNRRHAVGAGCPAPPHSPCLRLAIPRRLERAPVAGPDIDQLAPGVGIVLLVRPEAQPDAPAILVALEADDADKAREREARHRHDHGKLAREGEFPARGLEQASIARQALGGGRGALARGLGEEAKARQVLE